MLTIKNAVLISLLAFAGSCAFKTPPEDYKSANPTMADPAKTFTSSLESPALQPLVLGNWQGSLPCADCEGITYLLTLQKDKTFQESMEYRGKNEAPVIARGTWLVNEDSVVQLTKETGQNYLYISKSNLVILDQQGQQVTSELADKYILKRMTNANKAIFNLEEKRRQGIDFIASGNTWNLEIDAEKAIRFRGQNNKIQLDSEAPTMQKLPGDKGSVYRAITNAGTLTVRINAQPCTDKATGQTLPYTVEVTANAQAYNGCGQYLTDNRLEGNWQLQEMSGKTLTPTDFPKGLPVLELQPKTRKAMGDGGCNRITGELTSSGDRLVFGNMASTKMACAGPAMQFETAYLQLLSGKGFTYQLEANRLLLKDKDQTVLVYKKAP